MTPRARYLENSGQHPEIQWADIIGMRHKVVHDYLGVDEDIVWHVAAEDLPRLVAALQSLIPSTPRSTPPDVKKNGLHRSAR